MLLTEEEAKKKWCPFARAPTWDMTPGSVGVNRKMENPNPEFARCTASKCMAWRWAIGSDDVGGFKRVNPEDNRKLGSCGLAGKVE